MARIKRRNNPIKILFGGILMALIGAGVIIFKAYPDYKTAKESYEWPQTKGQVSTSKVSQRKVGKKKKIRYRADISYSYEVNGKQYVSSQLYAGSRGTSSSNSSDAYHYTSKYPVGRDVVVYYSKKDASNAVLEAGVKSSHYVLLGVGFFFMVVGCIMSISMMRKLAGIFILLTKIFAFVTTFFRRGRRSQRSNSKARRTIKRREIKSSKGKAMGSVESINLDAEMSQFNKVSSSSRESSESPWLYKWYIKGKNKNYGPYTFEKILDYYKRGKVKGNHQCYSSKDAEVIKISSIIDRKKAS